MRSNTNLFAKEKHTKDFREHLCPGMYDAKCAADISFSPALESKPLSSLISRAPRFGRGEFKGHGLGSTYRPDHDAKKWSKPITISKTPRDI